MECAIMPLLLEPRESLEPSGVSKMFQDFVHPHICVFPHAR